MTRRLSQRRAHRRELMNSLADARPARLDPNCPPGVAWPDAYYFTRSGTTPPAAEETSSAFGSRRAGEGQAERVGRRAGGRTGLRTIPAAAGALAMCVIIALIVVVRAELHQPHHAGPASKSSRGAPSVTFHDLRLTGHWRGRVAYGVSEGVGYLTGSACATTGNGAPIATLPPGARPARTAEVVVTLGQAGSAQLTISPNGQLSVSAGGSGASPPAAGNAGPCGSGAHVRRVWLSGVSFPLSS